MSVIPNTSEKYETDYLGNVKEPKKINPYYEGILPEDLRHILREWDYCMESVKNFFCSISDYSDSFCDISGFNAEAIDENALLSDEEEDYENANNETKLMATLLYCLLDYMSSERNATAIGMIESMDDDEYERNVKKLEDGV